MAREGPGLTLQTTALVNEAYLRLVQDEKARWENRRHFFGSAAESMRRILVERARRRDTQKRGGDRVRVPLEDCAIVLGYDLGHDLGLDLLALDEALDELEERDPRASQVVKLRCFVGAGVEEIADILGISVRTVRNDWNMSRAWLRTQLDPGASPEVT